MSWTDYSNTEANAWDANAPSINSSYEKNEIAFDTRVPQEQGSGGGGVSARPTSGILYPRGQG